MLVDILIILNNFFHDLAAAMWFCGTLCLLLLYRQAGSTAVAVGRQLIRNLFFKFRQVTNLSMAVVLLGGVVRALNYQQYEWFPALGRGQVTLLVIKHILLLVIVVGGVALQLRLSRRLREL